jgi:hypothetical protein
MHSSADAVSDEGVAEFIDLARSANVFFDLIHDRLTVRAINPRWEMWKPCRHLLDEIGSHRIEAYLRNRQGVGQHEPAVN